VHETRAELTLIELAPAELTVIKTASKLNQRVCSARKWPSREIPSARKAILGQIEPLPCYTVS